MKDLQTSTLDGAAGFEKCRYDNQNYRNPLAPTDRELRQEEEYYRNLEQQEDITDHEPA